MKLFNTTTISLFFVPLFATTTVFCSHLSDKSFAEAVAQNSNKSKGQSSSTAVVISHKKHNKNKTAAAEATPEPASEKMVMGELSYWTKFNDSHYGAAACVLSELQNKNFKKNAYAHLRRIDHAINELMSAGTTRSSYIPDLVLQIATYVPEEQNKIEELFNLCEEQEVQISEIPYTLAHNWLIAEHAREMSLLAQIWASSTIRIRKMAALEAHIRAMSGITVQNEIPPYSEDSQLFSAVLRKAKSEANKKVLAAQKDKDDSKKSE